MGEKKSVRDFRMHTISSPPMKCSDGMAFLYFRVFFARCLRFTRVACTKNKNGDDSGMY